MRGRVDGAALDLARPDVARDRAVRAAGTPIVLVDREHDALPAISVDDVEGGRMAGSSYLLGLGHRRIGFVGDEEENPFGFASSARRREGFEAALRAAGAPLRPEWIRRGPHGREAGRDSGAALLALEDRPTAIFADLRRPGDRGARGRARGRRAGARASSRSSASTTSRPPRTRG